jgi:MFS family permease
MSTEARVGKKMYAGVFFTSLSALMLEILLTRIFSVTMWYHFAFMAISIAMFGMTVGAVAVYLLPQHFAVERARAQMTQNALLFSLSSLLSFLVHIHVRFEPKMTMAGSASVALTFCVLAIPFLFAGICVTIALTSFPSRVSRLYAADLVGAAAGSFLLSFILGPLNGPTAVVFVAFTAGVGALLFALEAGEKKLQKLALTVCLLFAVIAVINTAIAAPENKLLAIKWVKGSEEEKLAFEKWNSYARVAVHGQISTRPFGWGLSDRCPVSEPVQQLYMDIDATAGTVLTRFNGDLKSLEFLKYDITNIAHFIRARADVLVIGTGGGRDVLSALVFSQKKITGVEINKDIITAVNRTFGDFTGHLDRRPGVKFINDEARSYLTRSRERYDLIQLSLIDTWSATAAGAFVLSENTLYTVDAWKIFLDRLTSNGIMTVSRWFTTSPPAEMYRLTNLAVSALRQRGVQNAGAHIILVKHMLSQYNYALGMGTLLVNRRPFTAGEIGVISEVCRRLGFAVVLAPGIAADLTFADLTEPGKSAAFVSNFPLNIAPPTDDSPFFFNMLRLKDAFNVRLWFHAGDLPFNSRAVMILGVLLVIILILIILCIAVPLAMTAGRISFRGTLPFFIFFSAIGMGFMMIEVAQMQRLCVFLGHPSYGLTVVLFSLLLACGLGSFSTRKIRTENAGMTAVRILAALLLVLLVFGKITPPLMAVFRGAVTPVRILVAVSLLFPPGILMGTAFPLGMLLARRHLVRIIPWYWGVNGAMSVFASVLAVAISLNWGIAVSFWTGLLFYALAFSAALIMAYRLRLKSGQSA